MTKLFHLSILVAFGLTSSGCSTFQGRPSPVISLSDNLAMVKKYSPDTAVANFYSTAATDRQGLTPEQYRNKVITVYMAGIDAQYANFVTAISTQNKGANIVLATLGLGLSSGAAIAGERTANILSTGAAFATGSQAQVNERLFYDKTLPAVVSSMNTARNETKVRILTNMTKTAPKYTMEAAFAELSEYQNAASIDTGIERLTAASAAKSVEVQKDVAAAASK